MYETNILVVIRVEGKDRYGLSYRHHFVSVLHEVMIHGGYEPSTLQYTEQCCAVLHTLESHRSPCQLVSWFSMISVHVHEIEKNIRHEYQIDDFTM